MATDAEILALVAFAFASAERPEHFTNFGHCDECRDHDDLLRSRDLETLTIDDVGNQGWDPIIFTSAAAFAYYIPALARLALAAPHPAWGWYGDQLSVHLRMDGRRNSRWSHCSPPQREAIRALLEHIFATRSDIIQRYDIFPEFSEALDVWSEE